MTDNRCGFFSPFVILLLFGEEGGLFSCCFCCCCYCSFLTFSAFIYFFFLFFHLLLSQHIAWLIIYIKLLCTLIHCSHCSHCSILLFIQNMYDWVSLPPYTVLYTVPWCKCVIKIEFSIRLPRTNVQPPLAFIMLSPAACCLLPVVVAFVEKIFNGFYFMCWYTTISEESAIQSMSGIYCFSFLLYIFVCIYSERSRRAQAAGSETDERKIVVDTHTAHRTHANTLRVGKRQAIESK